MADRIDELTLGEAINILTVDMHNQLSINVNRAIVDRLAALARRKKDPNVFFDTLEYWLPGGKYSASHFMGKDSQFLQKFSRNPYRYFPELSNLNRFPPVCERYVQALDNPVAEHFQDHIADELVWRNTPYWFDMEQILMLYVPYGEFDIAYNERVEKDILTPMTPEALNIHIVAFHALYEFCVQEDTLVPSDLERTFRTIEECYEEGQAVFTRRLREIDLDTITTFQTT